MALKRRDLCGIIAIGEILRFVGMLCLRSAHVTMDAKPPSIFSFVSFSKHLAA
jgi:hypothetical protein